MTTTALATGLTAADVAERTDAGLTNAFTPASSRSVWSIVRANTLTLFNGIIAGCFLVLLLIGRWQDALFGLSAIANAIIGSVQEFRAKRSLDRLALLNAPHARVLRDGAEADVPVGEVVRDDILVLRAGDQVPADAVVVDSTGLQLDESMLTGESDPIDKGEGAEVLSGSIVVGGSGLARADRVGAESFANRFAGEARRFSLINSELRTGINRVLRVMAFIVGPIALLVVNSQMMANGGWPHAIESGTWRLAVVATIASIVAMIPLGLVLMTSIAFAVGAVKLSTQNVLVQELAAVEGLARVDIICLDKTGTLTEGEIVYDDVRVLDDSAGWQGVLAWYGVQADSNATARSLAPAYTTLPGDEPIRRIAFSSARKWSAVDFAQTGSWVLGGPEMVFGQGAPEVLAEAAKLAASGLRTLVLAHSPQALDAAAETLPERLSAAVLVTFREKVRPDAAETLAFFAAQGVAVRVISGDNAQTVAAIGRELGLDAGDGFDARQLPEDDDEFARILDENVVFGRVTPEQKKRIVLSLKARGHTVAMTGDGVNDALAIKEADIGIAMNSGSAATKAVARLILLDGRFSHLPGVVDEGRQVIANIERVSMLFLTKTSYATGLAIVFGALLLPFPFLPRQETIIDGLTIGIPSFFLTLLPNRTRYEPGFLRRSLSFAIPAGIVVTAALAVYSKIANDSGISVEQVRTGSTLLLTIVGLWILVVLSRPVTTIKALVIGAMMIALIVVYSVPLLTNFLQLVDPGFETAVLIVVTAALTIAGIEVVRFAHLRYVRRMTARRTAAPAPSTAPRSLPR
ncbi:MAG: family hydrolase [Microbacteriaceae bacterium]|nr:family hydrolase [Microbacteriaceae bacterium]